MSSPVAQALISSVISEWTDASHPFTAYQVSKEVQRRMKDQGQPFERHNDLKNDIHQCQQLADASEYGDYTKTLVSIGNGHQAFLYHPTSFDASTWVPTVGTPDSAPTPAPALTASLAAAGLTPALPAASTDSDGDNDDGDDGSYNTDYRGRLMIPVQFMRDLGLKAGNTVYVVSEQDEVTLSSTNGGTAKSRLVERNGDIRVLTTELQAAGLSGNKFNIELKDVAGAKVVSVKAA
jgi:bifunctional DNA-binding transcriptional regulator/antitoxin component of YhaV-PrlF toxin-antitoxin module